MRIEGLAAGAPATLLVQGVNGREVVLVSDYSICADDRLNIVCTLNGTGEPITVSFTAFISGSLRITLEHGGEQVTTVVSY